MTTYKTMKCELLWKLDIYPNIHEIFLNYPILQLCSYLSSSFLQLMRISIISLTLSCVSMSYTWLYLPLYYRPCGARPTSPIFFAPFSLVQCLYVACVQLIFVDEIVGRVWYQNWEWQTGKFKQGYLNQCPHVLRGRWNFFSGSYMTSECRKRL